MLSADGAHGRQEDETDDGLKVAEDSVFARREQRFQRAGYVLMAALIVAALLGLAGQGPISRVTASADGLSVTYERIVRQRSPARIVVDLPGSGGGEAPAELSVSRGLFEALEIAGITPEPDGVRTSAQEVVLQYESRPGEIVMDVRYQGIGLVGGEVEAAGERLHLTSFVLP